MVNFYRRQKIIKKSLGIENLLDVFIYSLIWLILIVLKVITKVFHVLFQNLLTFKCPWALNTRVVIFVSMILHMVDVNEIS
jgi:hypothetical protein